MSFKSGFITIIGRPNAGKSTLLNALLKEKIAIATPKAQTTRNNISGILTTEDTQYIFIDTPGIHKPKHELGKTLNRSAYTAIQEADLIFYMVDATQPFGSGDQFLLERIQQSKLPCFLILSKIDLIDKEKLLFVLTKWQERHNFDEIIPISALTEDNLDTLLKVARDYMQEGGMYFPEDMKSDHGLTFQLSEIIREKVLLKTNEEVPHSVAVVIEKMDETDSTVYMNAMIIVERNSQKAILIGKQAAMIRSIRLSAQKELKEKLGKKVELELYVRVENNWRNRRHKLSQFGYLEKEED